MEEVTPALDKCAMFINKKMINYGAGLRTWALYLQANSLPATDLVVVLTRCSSCVCKKVVKALAYL